MSETHWDRVHRIQKDHNISVSEALRVARFEERFNARLERRGEVEA